MSLKLTETLSPTNSHSQPNIYIRELLEPSPEHSCKPLTDWSPSWTLLLMKRAPSQKSFPSAKHFSWEFPAGLVSLNCDIPRNGRWPIHSLQLSYTANALGDSAFKTLEMAGSQNSSAMSDLGISGPSLLEECRGLTSAGFKPPLSALGQY